jgi:mannitol-specific phosphotransferase system IIBC component
MILLYMTIKTVTIRQHALQEKQKQKTKGGKKTSLQNFVNDPFWQFLVPKIIKSGSNQCWAVLIF